MGANLAPTGLSVGRGKCALILNRKKIDPEGSGGGNFFQAAETFSRLGGVNRLKARADCGRWLKSRYRA
jgi:hypothetical protein